MSERVNLESQKRAEARLSDSEFDPESESDLWETADSCPTDDHFHRNRGTRRNNPLRRHRNMERDYRRLEEENNALRIERDNYKKLAFGLFAFLVFIVMYFTKRRPRTANNRVNDIHQDHDNNVVNDQADVDGVDDLENIDLVNGNVNIVDGVAAAEDNENQINENQPGNNEENRENPDEPPVLDDEVPVQENRPDNPPVVNNNQTPIIQCQNYCPHATMHFGVYAPQPEGNRGRRGSQPNEMPEAHV